MIRPFRALVACAALFAVLLTANGAAAVTLVAVVVTTGAPGGVPITSYDVDQRVAMQAISGVPQNRTTALNELIDEAIQSTEAIYLGVTVAQSQVDAAFANIARQVGLGLADFEAALRQAGVNPDSLKQRLRAQIYWSILLQARLQIQPAVRQDDVTAALIAQGANTTVREYRLQQIIFVVPQGSTNAYINQRRSEAEAFRQRFTGCENSLAQAAGLRDVTVRDVGRDLAGLNQAQVTALETTAAGRTTRPEQTSRGIEILAVCSVVEVQANEQARAEVQNRLLIDLGEQIGQTYLAELRARATIIRY